MDFIVLSKYSIKIASALSVSLALLLPLSGPANAGVIVKEKEIFYSVSGKTGQQIFESIRVNGPRTGKASLTGGAGHAIATAEFGIDFINVKKEIVKNRCRVINVDLVLNVKYTYPKWKTPKGASKNMRREWKKFSNTVQWHEQQHTKIAKEYAKDYEKIIRKTRFKASTDCDEFTISSMFRVQRAAIKSTRKQRNFDRKDLRRGGRGFKAQRDLFRAK